MSLLRLALIPPVLFTLTGLIDTFLTKRFRIDQNEGILMNSTATLMIIGGAIALLVTIGLFPFVFQELSFDINSVILIVAGIAYGLAAYPYFESLYHEKIENVIPVLQTIPVFAYILGLWRLSEYLSVDKVLLIVAIVVITMLFSWASNCNQNAPLRYKLD